MKNEQNQEFSLKLWVFPFSALALLLCFALIPFGRTSPEEKIVRARAKAEVLAYQVAQLFRESARPNEDAAHASRGPASIDPAPAEGLMGQDPWGHAYTYKIVPEGEKLRVEMRSAGPDGVQDLQPDGDDVKLTLSL